MTLSDKIDTWETNWCSQSEGMNPKMREELDEIFKEFIKELKEFYRGWGSENELNKFLDELAGSKLVGAGE